MTFSEAARVELTRRSIVRAEVDYLADRLAVGEDVPKEEIERVIALAAEELDYELRR